MLRKSKGYLAEGLKKSDEIRKSRGWAQKPDLNKFLPRKNFEIKKSGEIALSEEARRFLGRKTG